MLHWLNQFSTCCFLDSHEYHFNHYSYECIAGAGAIAQVEAQAGTALAQLTHFQQQQKGWLFGHLSYDLKNETEALISANPDALGFPDLFFFSPQTVLLINQQELCIAAASKADAAQVFEAIAGIKILPGPLKIEPIDFQHRLSRPAYINTIEKLRGHILRGDCYEINYCQEFYAENVEVDPIAVYLALSEVSPSPFAAFYKLNNKYLVCGSPERYLKKQGDTIISQPIKGTGSRSLESNQADEKKKAHLYNNPKDRAENVMVVDLVRNDLSKICCAGTVTVDELFGIYSFPQVHQMISTVSGKLAAGISLGEVIRQTFPMGSMTGAPKKKVMELIEEYETSRRGIFSGAVGYIRPGGDFDFNVVIRSVLYNQLARYLAYFVGSGITFYSKAEEEYEECLLKAAAIKKIFS